MPRNRDSLLVFCRWFPESPRWLIAKGRLEEAQDILERFALKSGKDVDSEHLAHVIREVKKADVKNAVAKKPSILDLLRTRKLRKRTIISCCNWCETATIRVIGQSWNYFFFRYRFGELQVALT